MTHFEVGKCYRLGEEGKTLYRIESRTEKSALIAKLYDDGSIAETMRKKIYTEECGNIKEERIYPLGKFGTSAYSVISSRYEAESTNTSQPEASQPEIVKFVVGKTYLNDAPACCGYGASYTITGKSREFVSFESYFLRKQAYKKLRIGTDRNGILCEYFDDKEKGSPYPAQMVYATALDPDVQNNADVPTTIDTPQTESAPAIIYGMSDVEKSLRRIKSKSSRKKSQHTPAENAQPESLYDDGSFSDAPGDNSCPDQDIPDEHYPDVSTVDNPCFTVEPSHEIERPNYTPYTDTITDYCPYVNISPCYTPTHNNAAVVPYEHAASIRNFFHIIAIYLRLWLAMHIHTQPDVIQSLVFAPWIVELKDYEPDDPHDVSPLIYKWQRKKFYEKLKLCRSQIASCKTREEIIACLQRVSSESIRLLCVADRVMNKFTRISANSECERKLAYAQIYADKIIQRREKAMTINAEIKESESITQPRSTDNPDPVQEIPAQVSDISPKTYWENIIADNQNSIINFTWDDFHRDNANMHPKLQAKFHDEICKHNFALVDACKSHDEIRQLLAGSTEPALIGIMNLTYDYFGTHGEYHPKEMDSIPHMIDSLIERIDYCREDKVYWTEVKKRQSSQQPQPQADAPKLLRLYLASDHKEYNRIRRENKARIDACDSEEGIVALMLTLDGTSILNQANYCRVKLHNTDKKTDEQLAHEFATTIIKRRQKKLRSSTKQQKTRKPENAPAPASNSEHTLIDTKDLRFSDRRKALEHNAAVITPCLFPEAAVALLMSISAKAIIQLGLYLGLFIAKQKGSKNAVIQEFVKRLFNLRETRSNQQNSNYATTPSQFTLHIPEGVKIIQLKNRQLGFIFIN